MSIKNIDDNSYPISSKEVQIETVNLSVSGTFATIQVPTRITRLGNIVTFQTNQFVVNPTGDTFIYITFPQKFSNSVTCSRGVLVHAGGNTYDSALFTNSQNNGLLERIQGGLPITWSAGTTYTVHPMFGEFLVN